MGLMRLLYLAAINYLLLPYNNEDKQKKRMSKIDEKTIEKKNGSCV